MNHADTFHSNTKLAEEDLIKAVCVTRVDANSTWSTWSTSHSFSLFFQAILYLPVSSVLLSFRALGPDLHCMMVLYVCNHAIYSPVRLWFCVVLFS